jgi:putative membrane protein
VLEYRTNSKGVQVPALDESILPWKFMTLTGKDPQVFQAIFMIALGVFIVVLIDKIAARLKTKI